MSVLVAGLCYEIAFGCPKRKAVAVALADHASHDGTKVFPSIALIAKKVEFSERTVQRTLRELEALGVLVVVKEGGAGPKDTREWAFDLALVRDLAAGHVIIRENKGDRESSLEGDSLSPLEVVRVTETKLRVTDGAAKGDTADTRTVTNHQLEPSTREGARATDSAARPRRAVPAITVRAADISWGAWLQHIETIGGAERRAAAERLGELRVAARWPAADTPIPELTIIRNPAGADA